MIGTIISLLIAIFIWFDPYSSVITISVAGIETYMIAVAVIFLFIVPVGIMLALWPLQKAEQNSTPHILEMFPKDRHIALTSAYLVAFSLVTFLIVPFFKVQEINKIWLPVLWVILLGIAIDAARYFSRRIMSYLNPFAVVGMFGNNAKKSIRDNREIDLCHWIDGLSEIAIKGIQRQSTSVSHEALAEEQNIARIFFEASKIISSPEQDAQTKALGITDKVSYVMFYLYQRFDVVFDKALKNKLEMTCSHIITLLGKISIDAGKYDISMASAPLRFIGKFARKSQDEGFEETAMTASCVLFEVAKALLTEIDITYYEIVDPFLSIVNGMEQLAEGAFQRNKNINLGLLIQPFKDLRALFEEGKAKEHQDTPVIVQNIDRVIGEFEALQMVMTTIPKIPEVATDDISPSQEKRP